MGDVIARRDIRMGLACFSLECFCTLNRGLLTTSNSFMHSLHTVVDAVLFLFNLAKFLSSVSHVILHCCKYDWRKNRVAC